MTDEFHSEVVWPTADMPLAERREAFGNAVRRCREQAGISQVGLSQATRISVAFLEALEHGRVDKLPGAVFGRGFLRSICSTIGQDPAPLLTAYDLCFEAEVPVVHSRRARAAKKAKNTSSVNWSKVRQAIKVPSMRWEIVAPAAIVIGAVVASIHMDQMDEKPAVMTSVSATKVTAPVKKATQVIAAPRPVDQATRLEKPVAAKSEPSQPVTAKPEPVEVEPEAVPAEPTKVAAKSARFEQVIEIKATSALRIKIKLDDKETEIRDLKPDTYRLRFEDAAEVLIYDAGAADVIFNGRSLGPIGKKGRLRKFSFEAKPAPDVF